MADEELLVDAPLAPDPDADNEMGPTDAEAIADEDLRGSRLLLVRREVKAIDLSGVTGGALEFVCTFQPAEGTRFTSARLVLQLATPSGVRIVDVAPRQVRENEPVKFSVDVKGKVGLTYGIATAGVEGDVHKEYAIYHCAVIGSGEGTSRAVWDFAENGDRKDGLSPEQSFVLTVGVTGPVTGTVSVSARIARPLLQGAGDAIRDLILGAPAPRRYPVRFDIPHAPVPTTISHFLD